MSLIAFISGALFAGFFVANGALQAIRGRSRIGFFGTFLAFTATVLFIVAILQGEIEGTDDVRTAVMGIAALISVVSLLILIVGRRRASAGWRYSHGLLGIGLSALLLVMTFTIPLTYNQLAATPTPLAVAEQTAPPTALATATASSSPVPSATVTATHAPTLTRTPSPQPTATETRGPRPTRTPSPTPTLSEPCLALVVFNLNLRAEPAFEADVMAVIPFDTTIPLFARNADSAWWLARYDGQVGWVSGEFLQFTSGCDSLPVRD